MLAGLISTIVEAPELLAQQIVPQASYDLCTSQGIATNANAAGNTNLLNLSGQNKPVGPLPDGFTGRGVAAMFFSVLSALLGMATIAWYGLHQLDADADVAKSESVQTNPEDVEEH